MKSSLHSSSSRYLIYNRSSSSSSSFTRIVNKRAPITHLQQQGQSRLISTICPQNRKSSTQQYPSSSSSQIHHQTRSLHLGDLFNNSSGGEQPSTSSVSPISKQQQEQLKPPVLTSEIVSTYWADVMRSASDPDYEPRVHEAVEPDEVDIRRLLSAAVQTGRSDGDLYPSFLARECVEFYESLTMEGRKVFLQTLSRDFGVNVDDVSSKAQALLNVKDRGDRAALRAEQQLRDSLSPAYLQLFRQINQLPNGLKFLVRIRADILKFLSEDGSCAYLRSLNESLKGQLQAWFGSGFLDLERISWMTPAAILEKIIRYEAVHPIPSWDALRQRLGPARLCYAFFHRGMPLEPLTFIQVALLKEIEWDVQKILNDSNPDFSQPEQCKTAVFYSISSSQKGLAGVDLGNFLIKRVVKEIQRDFPQVETFCTLSPIPGFQAWLDTQLCAEETSGKDSNMLELGEIESLMLYAKEVGMEYVDKKGSKLLEEILEREWWKDPRVVILLKPILIRLCSRYLLLEKKRSFAVDPVGKY
ncbi:hypothetical protein HDU76_010784 [Blyttiomyces sp. JEL0837]|nr:hypothetical protein HDU76_010784 [Blyttiomyces sp. JEL0837]